MRRRKQSNNGHLPAVPEESVADLMTRDPALYERIVDHLEKDGWSPNAISALCNVNPNTVRRIRNLLPAEVRHAAIRNITSNLIESCQLLSARLIREYDQIPASQMASSLGVLVDKLMLLTGGATSRVEVEHTKVPSSADLKKMFEALPKANAREITPPHSNGTNPPTAHALEAPQA